VEVKVHVTLREDVRKDEAAKQAALEKVLRTSSIRGINRKRFERYGVISGDLADDAEVGALENIAEVSSVEKDSQKFAV
jgi:hypothetical protein